MRVLGLDIGTTTIKAVELETSFRGYEIHEYHEYRLTPGIENPIEATAKLLAGLPRKPDRLAVALPTRSVTSRLVEVPTKDKKAIQAAVMFELEDDLPFSIEDMSYQYSVFQSKSKLTRVFAQAAMLSEIESVIDEFKSFQIDPDLLTTEPWSYRVLMGHIVPETSEEFAHPILVADLGHARSNLHVLWKGVPYVDRELEWGGRDLTEALVKKFKIPYDQAEVAKLDHGFVLPQSQKEGATPDQIEFADTLYQLVLDLIWEIQQVEFTFKSKTGKSLGTVYICGGTSLLPGLIPVLEEALSMPVKPLHGLSGVSKSGVTYSEQTDATFGLACSLGLSMIGDERSHAINFRKGVFSKKGIAAQLDLAAFKKPLASLAIIGLCFSLSYVFRSTIFESKSKEIDSQLEKNIKNFFGKIGKGTLKNYLRDRDKLKKEIKSSLDETRELAALRTPNKKSPLLFLKAIAQATPRGQKIELLEYKVGSAPLKPFKEGAKNTVKLTFLVPKKELIESLKSSLASKIDSIEVSKPSSVGMGTGKPDAWKVSVSGVASEAAYAE